jgi:hypothetical protein
MRSMFESNVFLNVTACSLIGVHGRSCETCCLHLQSDLVKESCIQQKKLA